MSNKRGVVLIIGRQNPQKLGNRFLLITSRGDANSIQFKFVTCLALAAVTAVNNRRGLTKSPNSDSGSSSAAVGNRLTVIYLNFRVACTRTGVSF